jgi:membrane protease YdiL (CAAX protease family)
MLARVKRYLETSRDPFVAALLVFPIYLLYQVGLLVTPGVRNGADLITDALVQLRRWHPEALGALAAIALVGYGVLLYRSRAKKRFSPTLFGLVALEGAALGVVMVILIDRVLNALLLGGGGDYPFHVDVILSLGAGFHEELVFRVLIFGGLVLAGRKITGDDSVWLVVVAAVVSSLAFSAVHYVGPLGDPFRLGSFVYRFFAGCFFAAVYRFRGFAVVVYTHAIYDIGVFALT